MAALNAMFGLITAHRIIVNGHKRLSKWSVDTKVRACEDEVEAWKVHAETWGSSGLLMT
jgi:hypothetical protein